LYTDWKFFCHSRRNAVRFHSTGSPVYLYRFLYVPSDLERPWGAYHGLENFFVFGNLRQLHDPRGNDWDVSRDIQERWIQFASTGTPNFSRLPNWPAFDSENQRYLYMAGPQPEVKVWKEPNCELWDQIDR
jgi:carboxylesterase type B